MSFDESRQTEVDDSQTRSAVWYIKERLNKGVVEERKLDQQSMYMKGIV